MKKSCPLQDWVMTQGANSLKKNMKTGRRTRPAKVSCKYPRQDGVMVARSPSQVGGVYYNYNIIDYEKKFTPLLYPSRVMVPAFAFTGDAGVVV